MPPDEQAGWDEYRRLVVKELEDRFAAQLRLEDRLSTLEKEVTILATRAALIATLLSGAASLAVSLLK